MRLIFGLVLVAGLAIAGFAVFMAQNYIARYQARLAAAESLREQIVKTVDVYVAAKPLVYGMPLTAEDVRKVRWPESAVPEGAFTSETALFPENEDRPRLIVRAMEKDEAILAVKVTEPGEDAGIASRLERGMRAFAINVDVSTGVSGFLRPGNRVDIYWTGRVEMPGSRGQSSEEISKLIESGIQVIAVDQSANTEQSGATIARTITVSATSEQVASLNLAQSTGRLALALVGNSDDTIASAVEINKNTLLGISAAPAPEPEKAARVCTRRERRGTEVVEVPADCSN